MYLRCRFRLRDEGSRMNGVIRQGHGRPFCLRSLLGIATFLIHLAERSGSGDGRVGRNTGSSVAKANYILRLTEICERYMLRSRTGRTHLTREICWHNRLMLRSLASAVVLEPEHYR